MFASPAISAAILLVAGAMPAPAADECPAALILRDPGITVSETRAARRYAECMSRPWLPLADQLAEKSARCATCLGAPSRARSSAVLWIDHIASELPGCETGLLIKRHERRRLG